MTFSNIWFDRAWERYNARKKKLATLPIEWNCINSENLYASQLTEAALMVPDVLQVCLYEKPRQLLVIVTIRAVARGASLIVMDQVLHHINRVKPVGIDVTIRADYATP